MTIRSVNPKDENYLEYRENSVRMLEHLEATCYDDAICASIAATWATLALAEASRHPGAER